MSEDYFESLLNKHVNSRVVKKLAFPTSMPVYGPLKLLIAQPPDGRSNKRPKEDDRINMLERENDRLRETVAKLTALVASQAQGAAIDSLL